jgi:rhodanese-related sulfurtransferase
MGVKNISAIELGEILKTESLPIIDIRPTSEYELGHISKARNISIGEIMQSPERYLSKNRIYYIICDEGKKSIALCYELRQKGYDVINVLGGIQAYPGPLVKY